MRKRTAREAITPTDPAAALHPALALLAASGADRFDPVRFRYIQAMAARSLQQQAKVANLVADKAWKALQAYESSMRTQRAHVALLAEQLESECPQLADQLQQLLDACAFHEIRRLAARQGEAHTINAVAALTQQLDAAEAGDTLPANRRHNLKAAEFFRDALQQQHADKLVARALLEAPESAGPLNPQKLALRSLALMRDRSPAYLGHFVAYVETLFWLIQLDNTNTAK